MSTTTVNILYTIQMVLKPHHGVKPFFFCYSILSTSSQEKPKQKSISKKKTLYKTILISSLLSTSTCQLTDIHTHIPTTNGKKIK